MSDLTVRQQTCRECIDLLYPENPAVPQHKGHGEYYKSLCYYCTNSIGGKPDLPDGSTEARLTFLEENEPYHPEAFEKLRHEMQQMKARSIYLENKVTELSKVRKTREDKW